MKKILIFVCLAILIYFIPVERNADQLSAFVGDETNVYLTQSEMADELLEAATEDQERMDQDGNEMEFVLIPAFIFLTVIIGVLLYNFTKDRDD